jgi:hypothetical protein
MIWAREAADRFAAELEVLALDPADPDPATAFVREAAERGSDLIVLSDAGMRDRTEAVRAPARPSGRDRARLRTPRAARRPPGGGSRAPAARGARGAGPTFAKLGQVLSTRRDLLPPEYIEELSRLQEDKPPLTQADVVAVLEAEVGIPWEDAFAHIAPDPLAAGTIAQVHRARLPDGSAVVVKVQRPSAEHQILEDMALLELFAEKAGNRPAFDRVIDLPAVFVYLSEPLRRELNFSVEAASIERIRPLLADFGRLNAPRVHRELSTRRLLVMEEVEGVSVREAAPR